MQMRMYGRLIPIERHDCFSPVVLPRRSTEQLRTSTRCVCQSGTFNHGCAILAGRQAHAASYGCLPLKAGTTTLRASATPANVASASTQAIRAAQKASDPRRQSIAAGNANRAGWFCRRVM